jgi:hypothetical protein
MTGRKMNCVRAFVSGAFPQQLVDDSDERSAIGGIEPREQVMYVQVDG